MRDLWMRLQVRVAGESRRDRAYDDDVRALELAMLGSPGKATRLAAAKALWGNQDGLLAAPLLRLASSDPEPIVRAAALRNMTHPVLAALRMHPEMSAEVSSTIDAAFNDEPLVVAGALYARAALDGSTAEAVLRSYAESPDAVIRRGAIQAFDALSDSDASTADFLAARLWDPERAVRECVMLELFRRPFSAAALPAFEAFAKNGPTAADRADAAEYARSLREELRGNRPF
jgi:hypothetical protein